MEEINHSLSKVKKKAVEIYLNLNNTQADVANFLKLQ